ncbi:DsrH/TusB family sulfur metabolism protein [Methanobacterium formicicum]|uniref:DsrH family protein n=1 Tax=Methanobacterium formicicum (strain DSM 3637 / PP1) TaxID=1204725 RepID=K2QDS9_METFP|nr:DsrH/TusB family sulfur metabolism protein [Methanobacterium formicicum]EKF86211.1 DsrH family protein [Methanobacterium formicicum DSM 3637]
MNIGFILTKSPSEQGFKTFMDFTQLYIHNDQISIYLVGNGVYAARENYLNPDMERLFKNSKVYVYGDDLKARGIEDRQLKEGLMVFSEYDDLVVDVMENFHQVVSF